jgi:Concanavalin A-like lectin/glucanases superfamily
MHLKNFIKWILAVAACLLVTDISGCGSSKKKETVDPSANPPADPAASPHDDPALPGKPPGGKPVLELIEPPVFRLPIPDSITSESEILVSGSCRTGLVVTLGGAVVQSDVLDPLGSLSRSCVDGAFSFKVSKVLDASYLLSVIQSHPTKNVSSKAATLVWTRDTAAPLSIAISQPAGGAIRNASDSLLIAGSCENGTTVGLSGASEATVACQGNAFRYEYSAATDADRTWTLTQTDLAGNTSPAVAVRWQRDSRLPAPPVIVSPAVNTYSNLHDVEMSGTCLTGFMVHLGGAITPPEVVVPANSLDQVCASGAYKYLIRKGADGQYDFSVSQTDPETERTSSAAAGTWRLDTLSPAAIFISQPAGGSLTSADSAFAISGNCEAGAKIVWNALYAPTVRSVNSLDGMIPQRGEAVCSPTGTFQTTMTSAVDGVFVWNLIQTDQAQNASTSVSVQWTRDSTMPSTPIITSPAVSTTANSLSLLTIQGACVIGNLVTIGGDVVAGDMISPAGQLTYTCAASSFAFTVNKQMDATYVLSIFQTNLANVDSASADLTWIRDTVEPAPVVLTNPAGSSIITSADLLVSGECETGSRILVSGAKPSTSACNAGIFSANVFADLDGTYAISVTQTDVAANVSTPKEFTWTRDSRTPSTPIISIPSQSPYTGTSRVLQMQGSCTPGLWVELGGIPASMVTVPVGSLGQTCSGSGSFAWTITARNDGTFPMTITQKNETLVSGPALLKWIVDSTPPVISMWAVPTNPNLSFQSVFQFSSSELGSAFIDRNESSETRPQGERRRDSTVSTVRSLFDRERSRSAFVTSYRCSLDGGTATACQSPVAYSNLVNGVHVFSISAVDVAGNTSAPISYSWQVNARKTIALYHLDTATGHLTDSSGFLAPYNSTLRVTGTVASATGKFSQADTITSTSYLSAAHNADTQNLPNSTMTIEAYIKLMSSPTTYFTIAAKTGVTGNRGWKFQIKKSGNSSRTLTLTFNVSTNGTDWGVEAESSRCSLSTSSFTHVSVTWNNGTVNFFCGGASKGTKVIGVAGSTLIYPSTAPLYIGTLAGSANALISLDEFRLSQMLRYTGAFTPPTSAFVGD